jgi:hypothetical protein
MTVPVSMPKLEMKIDLNVIEHLGLKMYTSLPAVIAEYVANAWDAGATEVYVKIPTDGNMEDYSISVSDNGHGMSVEDVNDKFLVVGRNRREEERCDEVVARSGTIRKVMGRKGLGKLAGFGVARVVRIRTVKEGRFIEFEMDYDEMRTRIEEEGKYVKTNYLPRVVGFGKTDEADGTRVVLLRLNRKRPPEIDSVRRNLARHFSVLGEDFVVKVNGVAITPDERDLRGRCQFVWPIDEFVDEERTLKVTGWIGTMERTVPRDTERGIAVMARGKLVQTPTTFDVGGTGFTGMHALSYMVGEIHAEFLDDVEDLIGTGRRSVVWEREEAQKLRRWANEKIKTICGEWVKKRVEEKLKRLRQTQVYKSIESRPSQESSIIKSFLEKLAERENVDEDILERVAEVMVSGVEYKAFLDLVEELDRLDITDPQLLIKFFRQWELIDAIELGRVCEGRLHVIQKFQELVGQEVKEVPDLHDFLRDNPWLLDPRWDYVQDEVNLSRLLTAEIGEISGGRVDFLCLGHGQTLNLIELKRPGRPARREDLEQIERYVDFARSHMGNDPQASYSDVVGYLIVGRLSDDGENLVKARRLAGDRIYVRTYEDLVSTAIRPFEAMIRVFKNKQARFGDPRLKESIERLERSIERSIRARKDDSLSPRSVSTDG